MNYDQLFGNPYTAADGGIVTPVVANSDVIGVTGAAFGSVSVNGSDTATIGFAPAKGVIVPTVLDDRVPADSAEMGLGAEVACRLHIGIGDTVRAAGSGGGGQSLTVVGIVLTPDSAGSGAALTSTSSRR